MSIVQGKQIANQTIEQHHLSLGSPDVTDVNSGATVNYVNTYVTSVSGETVIGAAEDGEYSDGIFTDFTNSTRVGVAIDRFNEMFKLLAPSPPLENWNNVFTTLSVPNLYTARALSSGSVVVTTNAFAYGSGIVDLDSVLVFLNGMSYSFAYISGSTVFHTGGVTPTGAAGITLYYDGVTAGFLIETDDRVILKYMVTT